MTISIRRARPLDIDWLLEELRAFADFMDTKYDLLGDLEHARTGILGFIDSHVVFVAECAERGRMGFIAGLLGPHPFNPKLITLTEMFWWVGERFRDTRAGLLLLNAFTEYGEQNAHWTSMALEAKSPVNERSLFKRGYRLLESTYVKESNTCLL